MTASQVCQWHPANGDRSDSLPVFGPLPLQLKMCNPSNARTGEISVTLSAAKRSSVTTPSSMLYHGLPVEARIEFLQSLDDGVHLLLGGQGGNLLHPFLEGGVFRGRLLGYRLQHRTNRLLAAGFHHEVLGEELEPVFLPLQPVLARIDRDRIVPFGRVD